MKSDSTDGPKNSVERVGVEIIDGILRRAFWSTSTYVVVWLKSDTQGVDRAFLSRLTVAQLEKIARIWCALHTSGLTEYSVVKVSGGLTAIKMKIVVKTKTVGR